MSLLSRVQSFARSALGIRDRGAPPQTVQAGEVMRGRWGRWDSKTTDRMNQAHWAKVTGLPINAELAYATNWLRSQAEYEISSNPVMEGLVNSHITDVVGPEGPHYRVTSSDSEYNRRREKVWRDWWRHAGANRQLSGVEILSSWVRSLWKAGEFGTQMINDERAAGPIKMRLLPVHMHRLLTPPEFLGDPDVALGVRRDENRNPISYYISEPYLFGPFEVYTGEFFEVKYEDFIHGYELTEEDQVRGVPWLASSLDVVAQLRDWDKAMLDAAEALSKTGVLWQMKNPDGTPTVVQSSAPMERGQHTFGPPGYEAEQLSPTQPSSEQQSFRASKKAEIGRGRCIPAMLINLDSSGHNYSSARFDNQPYWRSVAALQNWIGRIGLDRIEAVVIREAELAGELDEPPDNCEHHWGWIKPPHVDPTKEAEAERGYLQNGTLAWSDAVISHGHDPDRILEIRQKDAERLEAAKLPPIPGIPDPSKAAGKGANGDSVAGDTKPGSADTGKSDDAARSRALTDARPIEVPDIRQTDHYSCGAAAAMAVGRYFSVGPTTLPAWKKALGTDVEESTRPAAIAEYFQSLGLSVEARSGMLLEDLDDSIKQGRPLIVCVQDYGPAVPAGARFSYGHYLVVIGIIPGYVLCQDSSEDNVIAGSGSADAPGRVLISHKDFLEIWHDRDADGHEYVHFGISVGPPAHPRRGGEARN